VRNKKTLLQTINVLLALLLTAWLLNSAIAGGGDRDAARKAWPMIENGALLIDVRSEEEFAAGHLDGAINISWDNTDALIAAIGDDSQRPAVFYCRTGNRVGKSMNLLAEKGYTNIYNATGLEALKDTKP